MMMLIRESNIKYTVESAKLEWGRGEVELEVIWMGNSGAPHPLYETLVYRELLLEAWGWLLKMNVGL